MTKKSETWVKFCGDFCILGIMLVFGIFVGLVIFDIFQSATGRKQSSFSYAHYEQLLKDHPEIKDNLYEALFDGQITWAEDAQLRKVIEENALQQLQQKLRK